MTAPLTPTMKRALEAMKDAPTVFLSPVHETRWIVVHKTGLMPFAGRTILALRTRGLLRFVPGSGERRVELATQPEAKR